MEEQVISRAHRMGATRPIYVETLAMNGTIEEQMLNFLQVLNFSSHVTFVSFFCPLFSFLTNLLWKWLAWVLLFLDPYQVSSAMCIFNQVFYSVLGSTNMIKWVSLLSSCYHNWDFFACVTVFYTLSSETKMIWHLDWTSHI